MSLFKIREFWCTHTEDDEYFDQNCLITTRLNSDSDFIVTGSQSGVLRIFKPSCGLPEDDSLQGFSAADLLIEKILDFPILQVQCGQLVSASQSLQLAVLHPRLLSVYALKTKEGIAEHGTQNYLERLYDHNLRRSAANLVIGPFGGTSNRDFICVQSLDGILSFFEQENFTFNCFLPDFLLPGPISYVKHSDSFVTCNSNWYIVSYKYKFMSESGDKFDQNSSHTKKINSDWSFNLGEPIMDISVTDDFINKEVWIMVLGERNLYCLNSNGKIKFMKKLDYSPMCFNTYVLDDNICSLVVSETNTLLIYHGTTLKWSAQLQFLPVSIKRVFLERIKGALILLSEEGRLECCYLGTEPSLFVAPPLASKELDFDKVEEELAELNMIIRKTYGQDMKIKNTDIDKELVINASVSPDLEPCTFEINLTGIENHMMCSITVNIMPQTIFEEVQVAVLVQWPLKVTPEVQFYKNVNEKTSFSCHVYLYESQEVPSLNVDVIATVISNLGVPKVISKSVALPMRLILYCCPVQKESEHKVTLNINEALVPLGTLFPEYAREESLGPSGNAVAFENISKAGKAVTILLAKSSGRYRLQSDSFTSLSTLIEVMISRLKKHYCDKSDFKVFYTSALPTNEVVLYVNNHFKARKQANKLQEDLSQLCAQFRVIQKRLVVKYRSKNPTPLTNLCVLLDDTYAEIIEITDKLQKANADLTRSQTELSCVLNIVKNLITLTDIEKSLKETLEAVFCNCVRDLESQGWEDVIDHSLCYLLRTAMAKSEKDKLRAVNTELEEVKDISKLEKHLSQIFERITKKEKEIVNLRKDSSGAEEDEPVGDAQNEETSEVQTAPIGSQFGESSTRLLSARKSLLMRRHKDELLSNKV